MSVSNLGLIPKQLFLVPQQCPQGEDVCCDGMPGLFPDCSVGVLARFGSGSKLGDLLPTRDFRISLLRDADLRHADMLKTSLKQTGYAGVK